MARTVKPEVFAARRREILTAAQRLVLTKGYERISIQDILNEVQISNGAFHHYFESRQALLEALIDHIRQTLEKPLLSLIHDPRLNAIEKLQGFFDTLNQLRHAHKVEVMKIGRVWYTDANALIRLRVDEAVFQQRAPLLAEIVRQGVQEGVFTAPSPEKTGEIIMALLQSMGNTHSRLLLSVGRERDDDERIIEEVVTTFAAYMEAIERVLGVPTNTFTRTDAEEARFWVEAARESLDAVDV
ncbi:TetR family transcriptional regulator [Thermosporothrix hazakensis]|jgi:AcrR family transcriptional regulator|uniref:TetR family transcriptional regulator n=1 Tax=Thermosporothrix hazakensis TaxID=644383 RepID=A0A326UAR4_THEHA|nr:TetR/AcrR family transcriptional regulator [Thermosporothrix hazakensis]PZW32669.1 TetR family transcriptional regulator [Thermosporothrix hazakensis]GCE50021.1 putative transcriptional regulator, TetR family protein [Thermosporothrix hazakensis]